MFLLYSLIYALAMVFFLPYEYLRRPGEMRGRWLAEKLGGGLTPLETGESAKAVWIHAVSVGEVIAAVPFIRALRERRPALRVVVSTITETGRKVARERLGGVAEVIYLPFDIMFFLRRAIRRLRPSLFVVMETELWPNVFRAMKSGGVPVVLLNGRISDGSFKGYRRIRFIMRRVLGLVDLFCMQEDLYAERIRQLGVEEGRVMSTGNFKFDISVKDEAIPWARSLHGPVIIAGSTHRGEDALMVAAFKGLREDFRDLNLIIAPRHPERFDEVEELLKREGAPYVRRSGMSGDGSVSGTVVLLDTVGELASVYRVSEVAVMGGSFIAHGGQNPLEPAWWGKPVVCGPHMDNFPFVREFYAGGAAMETDGEGLYGVLKGLMSSPEKRRDMGRKGRDIIEKNRGAVKRAVGLVERYLRPGEDGAA